MPRRQIAQMHWNLSAIIRSFCIMCGIGAIDCSKSSGSSATAQFQIPSRMKFELSDSFIRAENRKGVRRLN
ncbi:MAG: hypothetical protein MHMPM18_003875 [Marteilia pararefringens]